MSIIMPSYAPIEVAPQPFPPLYGSTIYFSTPPSTQSVFVSLANNTIALYIPLGQGSWEMAMVNQYNTDLEYTYYTNQKKAVSCAYANISGQVSSTMFYPDISSGVLTETNVNVQGVLCDYYAGSSTCIVATNLESPFCGPFRYYQAVSTAYPYMLEVLVGNTTIAAVYMNFTTNVSQSAFHVPPRSSCSSSSNCSEPCPLSPVKTILDIPICNPACTAACACILMTLSL